MKRGWTKHFWTEPNEAANVQLHPERFKEIRKLALKDPSLPPSLRERVFICSMGDTFHRVVPDEFLHELFGRIIPYQHIYMLLTKRPERAADFSEQLGDKWPEHAWLGTSIGHADTKFRIEHLRRSKAKVRFISAEPLLSSLLPIDLTGIHMVIVGGESGSNRRPMEMQWARELRDECARQGVAFFMKQDAAFRTEARRYLVEEDGRCFQYRQFPGELTPPIEVQPDNPKWHKANFQIIGQEA